MSFRISKRHSLHRQQKSSQYTKSSEFIKHIECHWCFTFCTFVRLTFKPIKQSNEMFWLSTKDNVNWDASDSDNVKLNYYYADLIEKEKKKRERENRKFGQK